MANIVCVRDELGPGSHRVICHRTHANGSHLNPSQAGRPVIGLLTPEGWKTELTCMGRCYVLTTEVIYVPADSHPSK